MQTGAAEQPIEIQWPEEAETRVPYQVFLDSAIYEREQERLFRGPVWNYVGLEAEIPNVGDFKATFIGDTPIVVTIVAPWCVVSHAVTLTLTYVCIINGAIIWKVI